MLKREGEGHAYLAFEPGDAPVVEILLGNGGSLPIVLRPSDRLIERSRRRTCYSHVSFWASNKETKLN
jgi:hypothetical protein